MGSEWQKVLLKDICSKIGSGATPKGGSSVYHSEGEFALIRSQNVRNESFDYSGLAFIKKDHADKLSNVSVEERDVLLNITGDSVARCCQVDPSVLPARVNQHVAIIRPKSEILDARFLRYYFISPSMQNEMLSLAGVGATRNALTKGMIEAFEIPLPPLPEQKAIAHILGSLDDKIELNRKMNETLEAMAQALFKSWFTDFDPVIDNVLMKNMAEYLDQNQPSSPLLPEGEELSDPKKSLALWERLGEGAFKGIPDQFEERAETRRKILDQPKGKSAAEDIHHLFPSEFEDTEEMGWIPKGWKVSKVGDIANVIDCLHSKKPVQSQINTGRILLQLNNICDDGIMNFENKYYITEKEYQKWINRIEIAEGDCVITNVGRVGATSIMPKGFKVAIGRNITAIRLKDATNYRAFLITLLTSQYMKGEILHKTDVGTILNALNVKNIPHLRFPSGGQKILESFERVILPLLEKRQRTKSDNLSLASLRDTLLPKLISGELRIPDTEKLVEDALA